ncbi:uncharacterized protein [Aegilops tauschii subsp. strangulata]|uniref:uncharacterized protein n=1 Tax=Aegilops tauschii subsp. strangulata TaxID=200361 RepID=UPI003CC8D743
MKWTPEAEAALQDFKIYLSSAPTLVAPRAQEPLLLYLAARNQVVNAAFVPQREVGSEEVEVAEPLSGEPNLSPARPGIDSESEPQADADNQKVLARKKMCTLRNPEATGRIVEWALELSSFALNFESTTTIQSRAPAEFIAEWTPTPDEEILEIALPDKEAPKEWIMYFDGAFLLQGAGEGVLLIAPTGEPLKYVIQMHFPREDATNNTAECEGLLAGLRTAIELGIKELVIGGDSQLIVKQVNKDYQSPLMEAYVEEVRKLEEHFDGLQTEHIPHEENIIVDHLSKCVAQKLPVEPGTFVLRLTQPSDSPLALARKRRKLNTRKHFPAELPRSAGEKLAGGALWR